MSNSRTKTRKKPGALDLPTARQMLPLVRSIVSDIVDVRRDLNRLTPEQDLLDDSKRGLDWNGRSRRYAVHEQMAQLERHLEGAVSELNSLGLTLVDLETGSVDFPTYIDGRKAAFSWKLGEEGLIHWRYSDESQRRPIPTDWNVVSPMMSHS